MKMIIIDPGHGGRDPGAKHGDLKEKDLVLDFSFLIKKELEKYECQVIMTRETDVYVSLDQRCDIANEKNADLFYSIHMNAGGGSGYEDYIYKHLPENSRTIDRQGVVHGYVYREALKPYQVRNRGRKRAKFKVLRDTNMPAILTENLFIDSEQDRHFLLNKQFMEDLAKAHAKGVATALQLKKKKTTDTTLYIVQCGAFKKKENAHRRARTLRQQGFESVVIKKYDE